MSGVLRTPGLPRAVADCTGVRQAVLRPVLTGVSGCQPLHAHRLPAEAPALQPWGAREFAFADIDGQVIHCVDWGVWLPSPDGTLADPRSGRNE